MASITPRGRKRLTLALAAVLTFTGAGLAYAYWTSTGTGDGTATTGTSVAFTITTEDAVGTIAPGSPGQTIDFTVTNSGEGVQYFNHVTAALADSDGIAWVPTDFCDFSFYAVAVTTSPQAGALQPGASVSGVVTVTLADSGNNQDSCQGQSVPVHLVVDNQAG